MKATLGGDQQRLTPDKELLDGDQAVLVQAPLAGVGGATRSRGPASHGASGDDAKTSDESEHLDVALADQVCSLTTHLCPRRPPSQKGTPEQEPGAAGAGLLRLKVLLVRRQA